MNRAVLIPAVGCLFAFAALLATFYRATGRETSVALSPTAALSHRLDRVNAPAAHDDKLLSLASAQRLLTTLTGEYLRPRRQWESSPHRLYSRAAPRPVPSTSATIQLAHHEGPPNDSFLVATITIVTGNHSEAIPCVVDRSSKEVFVFAQEQWLTSGEWLKTASMP